MQRGLWDVILNAMNLCQCANHSKSFVTWRLHLMIDLWPKTSASLCASQACRTEKHLLCMLCYLLIMHTSNRSPLQIVSVKSPYVLFWHQVGFELWSDKNSFDKWWHFARPLALFSLWTSLFHLLQQKYNCMSHKKEQYSTMQEIFLSSSW